MILSRISRRPVRLSLTRYSTLYGDCYSRQRCISTAPPLISIKSGTFYRTYPSANAASQTNNPPLFPDLSFTLPSVPESKNHKPQNWAIIGSTGRTVLLNILRGQYIAVPPNARTYPYLSTEEIATKNPRLRYPGNAIQYVGFSGEGSQATGGTRGAYLSARYESLREDTDWTVRQYLRGQTSLNPSESEIEGKIHDEAFFDQVVAKLKMAALLDMPVSNLSNGQTRRARIAKALLSEPELLLLDEPFMGLDPATVNSISVLLKDLAEKSAPRLVLSLRPQDTIPDWITHLMILGKSHRVLFQGDRSEAEQVFHIWKHFVHQKNPEISLESEKEKRIYEDTKAAVKSGILDRQFLLDMNLIEWKQYSLEIPALQSGEPIVEMEGVRVQYGDKVVLGDWKQTVDGEEKDGLHWKVRRGQRWAILGANGSGKTTVLSLITSDHPQTYGLPIRLFGRSRLAEPGKPAISIFDLQRRIGHSSPEVHAFFPRQLSVRKALESAWAETFLSKPVLDYEKDLDVDSVLRFFKADLDPNAERGLKSARKNLRLTAKEKEAAHLLPSLIPGQSTEYLRTMLDEDVDFADTLLFSDLTTAQQRLVLFLRAIISKPDLIILDEAFSGMSPSLREKCFHFLERGEKRPLKRSAVTLRRILGDQWHEKSIQPNTKTTNGNEIEGGIDLDEDATTTSFSSSVPGPRFTGLTDNQALLMISHVKEEIPECVRHWMRLPSDDGLGNTLDFRLGVVKVDDSLSGGSWDRIWNPNGPLRRYNHRRGMRNKTDADEKRDSDIYEYYTA